MELEEEEEDEEEVFTTAAGGATRRRDETKTVVHYKVELPPCFHGDGKDKESFSLWKARLELAVQGRRWGGARRGYSSPWWRLSPP